MYILTTEINFRLKQLAVLGVPKYLVSLFDSTVVKGHINIQPSLSDVVCFNLFRIS